MAPTFQRANPRWSLGVLNDRHIVDVPGFVQLLATQSPEASTASRLPSLSNVAETTNETERNDTSGQTIQKLTKDGNIILEPQPDESPNDPLNWPDWKRELALLSVGFFSMLGGGITPLIAAGFTEVAAEYDVDVESVALTTGFTMMGLGVGAVIVSPTAIIFGKRPVFLTSAVLVIATTLWAAWSPIFNSLLAARVFQGIAASSVECLPSTTITEIFFLHERANRLGIYTLLLLGGRNLIPLVSAAVIGSLGWRWAFWITAIVVALAFVLMAICLPESFWDRSTTPSVAPKSNGHSPSKAKGSGRVLPVGLFRGPKEDERASARDTIPIGSGEDEDYPCDSGADIEKAPPTSFDKQSRGFQYTQSLRNQTGRTFVQQLRPFHGRFSSDNWFKVMFRPFILFAYPAILWSAIVYACSIGWLIVISETVAIIYQDKDRYSFSALETGLVYVSPFVGGVIGSAVAGKVSDFVVKAMASRNNGLYEPEFRLVVVIPVMIATCAGLVGYGWSAQEKNHWIVPTIFFGTISFGCSLGSTTSINFALDSYRQFAGEALVTLNLTKNICHGLVFSLFVTQWLAADGPKRTFMWIGIIQLVVMLLTVPMYIFGKRVRAWTLRKNLMEKF